MEIYREFCFDSAHFLPNLPDGHKCGNLHGHTYHVRIYVAENVDEEKGWIIDFSDIKKIVQPVIDELDHRLLNEIEGLDNPTSENIARWVWERLENILPGLHKVEIRETPFTGCIYEGA